VEDIQTYREAIKKLAEKQDNLVFLNSGAPHASIVMSTIFKKAQNYVHIFAGNLNGDVSNDKEYLDELGIFLSRKNACLEVITEVEPKPESKAFNIIKEFKSKGNASIHIYELKNSYPQEFKDKTSKDIYHFMVADSKMFRLEMDKVNYKAYCSFNNSEMADSLDNFFETLKKNSEEK
jgi:hypothetical protein